MKIALTADPDIPVPPRLYGGIERVIDMLAQGLVEKGHEVTLFSHRDSCSAGRLIPWLGASSSSKADTVKNAALLARHVAREDYDVIHSFSRIAYLLTTLPLRVPKLMTYQRKITPRSVRLGYSLSIDSLEFSAISEWMMQPVRHIGRWHLVPNGVPLSVYEFRGEVAENAPLVFLGRIEEIKGPHLAIEIAKRSNSQLIIAGNIPDEHQEWYEKTIKPYVDGVQIQYIGPVDDVQKNSLLGQAQAFLMPILWEEPFGIVMAEAMACGTPVLGLNRGAVPEVVADEETGFVRDTVSELIDTVSLLHMIDRKACRARVEKYYSESAVVDAYLNVYHTMVANS